MNKFKSTFWIEKVIVFIVPLKRMSIIKNIEGFYKVIFKNPMKIFKNLEFMNLSYKSDHSYSCPKRFLCSSRYDDDKNYQDHLKPSDDDSGLDENDVVYEEMIKRELRTSEMGHQVFIIQPYIKWGPSKNHLTKPIYKMNESIALIETLQNWKVVDKEVISLTSFKKVKFFGKGNLEMLRERISKNKLVSAVFLSVNLLSRAQQEFLEETFRVPVYDRYNIVIQIFHKHAESKEAKLQVAMAEIPFLWYRIKGTDDKGGGGVASIGGSGETLLEVRKRLLTAKEQKIKKSLKKLEIHRAVLRNKRKKKEFPVIAVVGYTNAGKTSLIKSLTEEEDLKPENKLFATLDVTVHKGILPSNIKVLFVDTIGFISDIPTELIEPFNVTLEDAVQSDLLIHVLDVSNPDIIHQSKHVIDTLYRLKLNENLLNSIINVGNKCDLVCENDLNKLKSESGLKDLLFVSCVKQKNINMLRTKIEELLLKISGRIPIKVRINNGGPEFRWLYKESSVVSVTPDNEDSQLVYMDVIITESNLMKFKHKFINSKKYQNQ